MKTHQDVIALWPSIPDLSRDVNFRYMSVWKWNDKNYIPPEWWCLVVEASNKRDLGVTFKMLAETVRNRKYIINKVA